MHFEDYLNSTSFKKERWNNAKMKKNKAHAEQMEAINMAGTYSLSIV